MERFEVRSQVDRAGRVVDALRDAMAELLGQEFAWSAGHLTALVNGCIFAPSLLTFWFVNGIADFSTAIALGTLGGVAGIHVRLLAYVLAVPTFIAVRAGYYLLHPVHRRAVLSGSCPTSQLFSLDWFTVGILVTGLPLALRDMGLWIGMNGIFLLGIFVLPRFVDDPRRSLAVKIGAIGLGLTLWGYVKLGPTVAADLALLPRPVAMLGPVATLSMNEATLFGMLEIMNSVLLGPPIVAVVAFGLNRVMTHPALTEIPILRHTLPRRDPWRAVTVSAAVGTTFYLLFVAAATGRLVLLPG